MSRSWPSTVVALGFLGLIAIVLVITLPRGGQNAESFRDVWGAVGAVVGVVVGAIPSFFFKQQADKARDTAERALAELPPEVARQLV